VFDNEQSGRGILFEKFADLVPVVLGYEFARDLVLFAEFDQVAIADVGNIKLDDIAVQTDAPRSVLEQVMPALRSAGIVRSARGRMPP